MELLTHLFYLFVLAIPIACVTWIVTREEIFIEPRNYCIQKSKFCKSILKRIFFYLFTFEYCFSHYVTLFILFFIKFQLLYQDWRGYLISLFALVWIANFYMGVFALLD